jgi:hypothetical protein
LQLEDFPAPILIALIVAAAENGGIGRGGMSRIKTSVEREVFRTHIVPGSRRSAASCAPGPVRAAPRPVGHFACIQNLERTWRWQPGPHEG